MEEFDIQEIDYNNATNKELEEILKQTEERYKESQEIVCKHIAIMDATSKIYRDAFDVLDKRMGGRLSKKRENENKGK